MSMTPAEDFRFEAELWLWQADTGTAWAFVTLPLDLSEEIREVQAMLAPKPGFGSVRVEAAIGETRWGTSVFPDKGSGCFVLPMKKSVRTAQDLEIGDRVVVTLRLGS